MNERTSLILRLVFTHAAPVVILALLALLIKADTALLISITQTTLLIVFFAGYWEFISKKAKWLFCAFSELLILAAIWLRVSNPAPQPLSAFWLTALAVVQVFLLMELINILRAIFIRDNEKLEITFPFGPGEYLITDGGNSRISRMMNYHYHSGPHKKQNTNKSMLYATDIIMFDDKADKFFPQQNSHYAVFGKNVLAPMDGEVVTAKNDINDNTPYSGNYPYNTGNTVVIKKDNYYFLLGHMQKGSIKVKEGDEVKPGTVIGKAGNSGRTERPHLHIQLMKSDTTKYWSGLGICIVYKGRNLYKNRSIVIPRQ